jgi:sugar phosphate isomerase/epimerase
MFSESSRRDLLRAAPLAAAATLGATSSSAMSPGAPQLKLGVASYSFRQFQRSLAIKYTKELGAEFISIKEFHLKIRDDPKEWARGRTEFQKSGLKITGGGTINMVEDNAEDIRFNFEYCKAVGIPMIVGAPSAKSLATIEKFVKQYDIKVAIHNHGPEDKHFPAPQDALKLIKDMDPRIGVCVDVGHTTRTGRDIVETVRECGPRLIDLHIKDLKDLMNKDSQVDVGDGVMPVAAIFKELIRMNYKDVVHLEYEINADNPMPGMQKSFAQMRGILAGLRA